VIEFDELREIVKKLRDPEKGCPWDVKQTHRSLVPNFIEELYEAIEAIENEDMEHLAEELGDLMLHIMMQTSIAEEENKFQLEEVLNKINSKLIRRHPHIFAGTAAVDAEGVKMNWERIKQEEKKAHRKSIIDGIPRSMPALIIAQRMQEKAASAGFDWQEIEPVFAKMEEEIEELKSALEDNNCDQIEAEIGDIIFTVVNLSRKLGFDAETCLKRTIKKFEQRFKKIEKYHKANNHNIHESDLEKLDEIWEMAKKTE
jgi:tetrapyrrole methylase family protein / MazG family protein